MTTCQIIIVNCDGSVSKFLQDEKNRIEIIADRMCILIKSHNRLYNFKGQTVITAVPEGYGNNPEKGRMAVVNNKRNRWKNR